MRWNIADICYASQINVRRKFVICDVCERLPLPPHFDSPPWHRLTQATGPVMSDPAPLASDMWTCFGCAIDLAADHMDADRYVTARACVETALSEQHEMLAAWRCGWQDAGDDCVVKLVSPYRLSVHKTGRPARIKRNDEVVSGLELSGDAGFDKMRYDAVWLATHGRYQRRIAPTLGVVGSTDAG